MNNTTTKLNHPLSKKEIEAIAKKYPTPFYLYDEEQILRNSHALKNAMRTAGFKSFRNYFAVKATPNPSIMKILTDDGQGLDCSSLAELELADRIGIKGTDIVFSSNNTSIEEFARAVELGAIINFDDISHIRPFLDKFGVPEVACCRFNPGNKSFKFGDEAMIGKPNEAKFGMTKAQVIEAYSLLKGKGAKRLGLHTMLFTNNPKLTHHIESARLLMDLAVELYQTLGVEFEFLDLGGGFNAPYRPEDTRFNVEQFASGVRNLYEKLKIKDIGGPRIITEQGRYMTAESGFLVSKVINRKKTYKKFIGLDASMANLMRPGMYGAYHRITVLGKEYAKPEEIIDVTGSICENNDKFAVNRKLPKTNIGDYLVIHTAGAHSHAMGFQYNGKLRSAELLLKRDGSIKCIRRAETLDDYFATLSGL